MRTTKHELYRHVEFEEQQLARLKGLEAGLWRRAPEARLVHVMARRVESEPIIVGDGYKGSWCRVHNLPSLPSTPETVSLYIADQASNQAAATITRRLTSITKAHQAAGYKDSPSSTRHFIVDERLKGIRRVIGTAQIGKSPLLNKDIRRIVRACPKTLAGLRDKALVLTGFRHGNAGGTERIVRARHRENHTPPFASRLAALHSAGRDVSGERECEPRPLSQFPGLWAVFPGPVLVPGNLLLSGAGDLTALAFHRPGISYSRAVFPGSDPTC